MSLLSTVRLFHDRLRRRHRQAQTIIFVSSLPAEIQKDIGWPDMHERSVYSDKRTRP